MSDFFNPGPNASNSTDPGGHKANHDVNQDKLHTKGVPGIWSQIIDLIIVAAIFVVIIAVIAWIV